MRSEVSFPNPRDRGPRYVDILLSLKSGCGWKTVLVGVRLVVFWNHSCGVCRVLSVFRPLQNQQAGMGTTWLAQLHSPSFTPLCRSVGGRAKVPTSKCSSTILSSVDGAVLYTQSPRYRLLGSVGEGDVSLTILNAQWSDNGEYGCRVEIPGWFNDHKVNIQLVTEEGKLPEMESD